MGLIHKTNQALKKIQKERTDDFLKEINEISKKYNLMLVPVIGKYKAFFEVQEIPKPPIEIPKTKESKLST